MENRQARELRERTASFALRVLRLVEALPKGMVGDVIGKQLVRAATSVGANYRAACRARSKAEFVSKLGVVVEEADEAQYWMELLAKAGLMERKRLGPLMEEAHEIVAIMVASAKTARTR